ncbi:hypothetical protein ABZS51_42600, partial [Nonomuraea sp. NPDC005501]
MTITAEPVTEPVAEHAEGPVWCARWGGLRWVDMLAGDLLQLDADGTVRDRRVKQLPVIDPVSGRVVGTLHQRDVLR